MQIEELPDDIVEAKNHVYYILSLSNLYCLSRSDNKIMKTFYSEEGDSDFNKDQMPLLMQFGFLVVKTKFALILIIHDRNIQFLDPFTLQPFTSILLPSFLPSSKFKLYNNILFSFGLRNLLMIELDYEAKSENESIFGY